jgi:hypothetical protein
MDSSIVFGTRLFLLNKKNALVRLILSYKEKIKITAVKVALNFNTNLKFVQFVVDQNSNVLIISRAMSKGFRDFISFFQIFCL